MQVSQAEVRPQPGSPPRNILVGLLLLLVGLGLLSWFNYSFIVPLKQLDVANSGNDFSVFWGGSRVVWQGGNPYPTVPGSPYRQLVIANGGNLNPLEPYISPYYLTLITMPFAALSLGPAAALWLAVLQLLMGAGTVLVIRATGWRVTPARFTLGLGLVMLWRYTFLVMMVGNLSLLLFFAIAASYYYSRQGKPYLAGALAGLLLLKPQVVFVALPLLLVVPTLDKATSRATWLNRETYQRWIGFGAVGLVFALYSFILLPGWVGDWLKGVSATGYADNLDDSLVTSFRSLLAVLLPVHAWVQPTAWAISGLSWLAMVVLWWRQRNNPASAAFLLTLGVLLSVLTTPYIRDYDNCVVLFPILLAYFSLRQLEKGAAGWRWSWLAWLLVLASFPAHLLQENNGIGGLKASLTILIGLYVGLAWFKTAKAQLSQTEDKR